jgi:3-hydroxyisobutyrate dehydrogenase
VAKRPTSKTVAVLGTGIMGYPMAANMRGAGLNVRVWNRTAGKAERLTEAGASIADTPAEAVDGADLVVTMLSDGPTVSAVLTGAGGVLSAMRADAVWVQMSTVGVEQTERLAATAAEAGIAFVDAPVLGTKRPAEDGALVVLESGPPQACEAARTVFDAVGSRTIRAGEAGAGSRLKMVVNNWVLAVTAGTAECIGLARALNVDPAMFLDAISGGALDIGYAHVKGRAMIDEEYPVSFPLSLAAKDARLVIEAAGSAVNLAGSRAALEHLEQAEEMGHGGADMAALYRALGGHG